VVRVPEGFGKYTDYFVRAFLEQTTVAAASALAREVWLRFLRPARLRALTIATLEDGGRLAGAAVSR
jgi:hypothetical protein